MTCLIGFEQDGEAWIGGDSFFGSDKWRDVMDRPKIFSRGKLLFAFSGNFYAGQIVETIPSFAAQRAREDDILYLIRAVASPIWKLHQEKEVAIVRGADDSFSALIGYNSRIYAMLDDYSIVRSKYGYMAIGIGEQYALGALAVTGHLKGQERAEAVLAASAKHCSLVCRPFHSVRIGSR